MHKIIANILFIIFAVTAAPAFAAGLPGVTQPADTTAAPETPKDDLGRDTPQGLVKGYLKAVAGGDFETASRFLELAKGKEEEGSKTAEQLQRLLDESGWIMPQNKVSDEAEGNQEDDLPPEQEKIGGIRTTTETVPVIAVHKTPKTGAAYWVISADTLAQVPALEKTARKSLLNKYLPAKLVENDIGGVAIGHWLAIIVIITVSYLAVWLIFGIAGLLLKLATRKDSTEEAQNKRAVINAFIKPVQIIITMALAFVGIRLIGLSVLAKQVFVQFSQVAVWCAFTWIIWNLIDVSCDIARRHLMRRSQYGGLSAIVFLRRGAKVALFIIVAIAVLDSFGFKVTTWLAALGLGGLAVALGAQKTVENFVGSLTVITDRPINIGELCRFGNTTGIVEDIGMRSTKVRTSERTIVNIPNGDFSSMQIENFSKRDKYFFNPKLSLSYEATPAQLRSLLADLRKLLDSEAKVHKNFHVNLINLSQTAISVEATAYVSAANADEANDIKEDLFLKVLDVVAKSDVEFAFDPKMLYASDKVKA